MLGPLYVSWPSEQSHKTCQGVACLLYVSWYSVQSDNPVQVAYSNTVYSLQITDSGVICEEITFNLIRLMPENQINV
jgi:hypothetical protein